MEQQGTGVIKMKLYEMFRMTLVFDERMADDDFFSFAVETSSQISKWFWKRHKKEVG
jgi:hypothetical protein